MSLTGQGCSNSVRVKPSMHRTASRKLPCILCRCDQTIRLNRAPCLLVIRFFSPTCVAPFLGRATVAFCAHSHGRMVSGARNIRQCLAKAPASYLAYLWSVIHDCAALLLVIQQGGEVVSNARQR